VRTLLLDRFSVGRIWIRALKAPDVIRFSTKYTQGWKASSQRDGGNSLRSYFRFKALYGERAAALSATIPTVAQSRLARMPKGIPAAHLTRVLQAFDRSTAAGKLDCAISRLSVDLGLRATEVARPQLDDVDR
jgi:integrase